VPRNRKPSSAATRAATNGAVTAMAMSPSPAGHANPPGSSPSTQAITKPRPMNLQPFRAIRKTGGGGLAFMCFGWSNRQVLNLSLPRLMDVFGLPGCWLLQSDDAVTLPCAATGASSARFSLAIPNAQVFAGLRCFLQPWTPSPGLNPANAAVGNGIAVTVGSL